MYLVSKFRLHLLLFLMPPPGKVGFYLRHLVCGLRLPPSRFFLEVLCYYKVHLVKLYVCHADGSKCSFQLTSYLVGDIPPKSIVVGDVVLDRNVDQMNVTPESPPVLLGFGPNAFTIEQLLDTSSPIIGSVQVGYSSSTRVVPPVGVSSSRKCGFPSCVLLEEELNEACLFIPCAEKIIFAVLGRDLKFFDGLLTLRDRFLAARVNVRVVEGMKLAREEMLVKVGEMYADLSIRYRDAAAKVTSLENQGTLVQAKYESCLQENGVLCSHLLNKS
ncbi:unnamed protein product [Lactuca virosa]|uniref:Uncharacterized protein n=1 Tax=Lactuca virosa TaxID=75947 RepID=A0AAU9NYV8_9ASTR|nr:unnamed protein product [Lactuca virosa]